MLFRLKYVENSQQKEDYIVFSVTHVVLDTEQSGYVTKSS